MTGSTAMAGGHAAVIGGSIAGLLAARVLADRFGQVTLVERDALPAEPANRKGVPQGRHLHVLLKRGEEVLEELFGGLVRELEAEGAARIDVGRDLLWFHDGGYNDRFEGGLTGLGVTRPLLETQIRRRVLADSRVSVRERQEVTRLLATRDGRRVTGLALRPVGQEAGGEVALEADLVVDAAGRGSRSPRWLAELGFDAPPLSEIRIGVHYTSREYERDPALLPGAEGILIQPVPPGRRGGIVFPVEGNRWLVALSGLLGDRAPADDRGFLEYAQTLPAPDLHDLVARARPLGGYVTHAFPSTIRHHYEQLRRFPERYLVVGDAISSFNPIYGQGMSVAAAQARALRSLLEADLDGLAPRFFRAAAGTIAAPWMIAVGADLRYPAVEGRRPPLSGLTNRYLSRLTRRALHDREVALAFGEVLHLLRPPAQLFAPRIALRVLRRTPRPARRTELVAVDRAAVADASDAAGA